MRKAAAKKELDFDLDYDDEAPADQSRKPKRARISATRVGIFGLGALSLAIVVNAAFLQDQRRSAPLFKITLAEPEEKAARPVQQTLPPLPPARVVEAPPQPAAKIAPPEAPRATASTSKVDLIAREIGRDPIAREIARTEPPAPKAEKPVAAQKPAQTEAKIVEKPRPAPARAEPRRNDAIAGLIDKPAPAQSAQPRETSAQSREAPSADVRAAQRDLQRLGFVIAPNGVFDAATRKAIAQFERDANMPARGELTAAVRRELSRRAAGE